MLWGGGHVYASSVETYDLTDTGGSGGGATLPCIWIKEYDSASHWERCLNHNDKRSNVAHTLETTGTYDCRGSAAAQTQRCIAGCGYAITLAKKAHTVVDTWSYHLDTNAHYKICTVCGDWAIAGACTIGCGETGVCTVCNTLINTSAKHRGNLHVIGTGNITCSDCKGTIGNLSVNYSLRQDLKVKANLVATLTDGSFISAPTVGSENNLTSGMATYTLDSYAYSNNNKILNCSWTVDISKAQRAGFHVCVWNGIQFSYGIAKVGRLHTFVQNDYTAPIFSSVTLDSSQANWSNAREITVKVIDATSDIITIGLRNAAGAYLVPLGSASQSGTTFTRVFKLTVEANNATNFYIVARDRHNNESVYTLQLQKTDAVAPTVATVSGLEPNIWRKSKDVRVTANDAGVGQVQIGFNSESNYKTATTSGGSTFYQDYKFTGTVKTPQTRVFYLKDGLGNAVAHQFQIGWLDNTAPTTPTYKDALGVGDGKHADSKSVDVEWLSGIDLESGVSHVEYSYNNKDFFVGAKQTVTQPQTIYARTVDKVGNISAVASVEVLVDIDKPEVGYNDDG